MKRTLGWVVALAVASSGALAAEAWVDRVLAKVQQGRRDAGVSALDRRAGIDAAAQAYADRIAALPHRERLSLRSTIDEDLERAGVTSYRQARLHMDLGRGYRDHASSFSRSWSRYKNSWEHAIDPQFDAVGLATAAGADEWVIFVAIVIDDIVIPSDLGAVERQTFEAINVVRDEHDLAPLEYDERLAAVAREYSEQMARLDFFSHTGADGSNAAGRILAHGLSFKTISENLHSSQGYDDPVSIAVSGWMKSKGHRKNILDPVVTHTGIGVALGANGRSIFTQLFMLPRKLAP